jgi:hypothetical protein
MTPLPLIRKQVRLTPQTPGCYVIFLEHEPYYAGMSTTSMRARLLAHVSGRGSKAIRLLLAAERTLYFEYCAMDPTSIAGSPRDVARAEFFFLLMHTGELLPGNRKADGISLFPDPHLPSRQL